MRVMLSAFGLAHDIRSDVRGGDFKYDRNSFFYNAPPFFPTHQDCTVDITPFILYDTVVVNRAWVEGEKLEWASSTILSKANISKLADAGILEIRDYKESTLAHFDALEAITENDLVNPEKWRSSVAAGARSWLEYLRRIRENILRVKSAQPLIADAVSFLYGMYFHRVCYFFHPHQLDGESPITQTYGHSITDAEAIPLEEFKWLVEGYLLHVNNNLLLAREFDAGIFDWFDYSPFYRAKAGSDPTDALDYTDTISVGERALSFYIPLPRVGSVRELLKLRDSAKGLREYIQGRSVQDSGADQSVLLRALADIEHVKSRIEYYMRIVSFFTALPAMVPLLGPLLDRAATEAARRYTETKLLSPYRWHSSLLDYSRLCPSGPLYAGGCVRKIPEEHLVPILGRTGQCFAYTKSGRRCRNLARRGTTYCHMHDQKKA